MEIRKKVKQYTGIPVSIGLAKTKTLSKVANYMAKHYTDSGVYSLTDNKEIESTLKELPVSKLWGIGKRHSIKLSEQGIYSAYDFMQLDEKWILKEMNITGLKILRELQNKKCYDIDINPQYKKNICTSRSFGREIESLSQLKQLVSTFAIRCAEKLRLQKSCAAYVSVFIHTNPFRSNQRQYNGYKCVRFNYPTNDNYDLVKFTMHLLDDIYHRGYKYKKAGVIVGGILQESQIQLDLFNQDINMDERKVLMKTIDSINGRMGRDKIRLAIQGVNHKWSFKQKNLSPCYTTRWNDLLQVSC